MLGNIYIGYQGVGKSQLAGRDTGYIDFESSNFRLSGGYRPTEWYKYYVTCAYRMACQGFNILVSSHQVVRDELYEQRHFGAVIRVFIIYPSLELKQPWIKKLHERFLMDGCHKNRVAYLNALDRYTDNILAMQEDAQKYEFEEVEIKSMDYNLKEMLDRTNQN